MLSKSLVGHTAACVLLLSSAWAQLPAPRVENPHPDDTSWLSCFDKPFGSRSARSETLLSPDGRRRAYAQVEARGFLPTKSGVRSGPQCVNTSRLFAAAPGSLEFKVMYVQEASEQELGNAMRVVDWSPDSKRLLVELLQWQYGSEGVVHSALLYNAEFSYFQQPDLSELFAKHFGRECALNTRVAGFTPEGRVVIEGLPLSPDEEEIQGSPSCAAKGELYELDLARERLAPLPPGYHAQRYGKPDKGVVGVR